MKNRLLLMLLLAAISLAAISLGGCGGKTVKDPVTGEPMAVITLADAPPPPGMDASQGTQRPPDMPRDQVKVTLPLYPGAKPTKQPSRKAFELVPGSPYLKIARVRYILPVPPDAATA